MERQDSPDNEFDQDMERVLRDHFASDSPDLRSPRDPWPWLESRMEEPEPPSFFSRFLGSLNPVRQGRLTPAIAAAGVAVVAVAVAAVVWASSGNGGPEGLAVALPATPPPGVTAAPRQAERPQRAAGTTAPAQSEPTPSEEGTRGTASTTAPAQSEPTPDRERPTTAPVVSSAAVPVPTPAPASVPTQPAVPAPEATEVPVLAMADGGEAQEESAPDTVASAAPSTEASMARALPTTAPQATAAPAMAADAFGPRGPQGTPSAAGSQGAASSGGTPPGTTFRDYQRQPFVAATEDNVSTFSLDTGRTSFQLALNWALAGYEIDPDSVRAEEWLNAFDYQYDSPSKSDEFAVTSDLYPHPLDESRRLARIAFRAPEVVDDKPLNVTLVLDASGSMAEGNRVDIARQAAESIRASLRPEDRIAVVHFTENVLHQYTVEHTAPDDREVSDSISWLQPHGSTNVQAGLNLGVELAGEVRDERPDAYNYVILMSDGVANVDATDPFGILETASDADTRNPLRLITIGVGIGNFNDPLLELLAQHGNGWYRYLDSADQSRATFARENWLALSTPFADQTRAQVTWDTSTVERWRIIGYENRVTADQDFTQDRKEFAEIYSGAATTVLYEIELTELAPSSGSVPLGTVELRWVDPVSGESRGQMETVSGDATSDFEGREGSLAHFAAIVALAADLYGGLSENQVEAYAGIHSGLSVLQSELDSLSGELGTLDSYRDFSFLLDHIAIGLEERLPPSTPTGYSR